MNYGDEGLGKLHVSKTYKESLDGSSALFPLTVLSTATVAKESTAKLKGTSSSLSYRKRYSTPVDRETKVDFRSLIEGLPALFIAEVFH